MGQTDLEHRRSTKRRLRRLCHLHTVRICMAAVPYIEIDNVRMCPMTVQRDSFESGITFNAAMNTDDDGSKVFRSVVSKDVSASRDGYAFDVKTPC